MRINVYSQELTEEVVAIEKESNTGVVYKAVQMILHSSEMLHHPPADDDRSAVTFWLPQSERRREALAKTFERMAQLVRDTVDGTEQCPSCKSTDTRRVGDCKNEFHWRRWDD